VINEMGIQPTSSVFHKDGLPVVHVVCADINQPRQPEANSDTDQFEARTRQDFKEPLIVPAQEPRAKVQTRSWPKTPLRDVRNHRPQSRGAFNTFGGLIEGRNVELIPNRRIVQAWRPAHWDPGAIPSCILN
jgi:hypothetical protein